METLHTLVIVRPGAGNGQGLSTRGRRQIEYLSDLLRTQLRGPMLILTPGVLQALQSAEILANRLDANLEQDPSLAHSHEHQVLGVIGHYASSVSTLIVIVPGHLAQLLPEVYADEVLSSNFCFEEVGEGDASVINCTEGHRSVLHNGL